MLVNGGSASSFQRLVKEYGGDISPRAVLEELISSKAAHHVGPRVALRATKIRALRVGLASLTRVIPALIDGLRTASVDPSSPTDPLLYRLRLHAGSEAELALIRQRCLTGIQSLLHGLEDSIKRQLTVPARKKSFRHALDLTVLLVGARNGDS